MTLGNKRQRWTLPLPRQKEIEVGGKTDPVIKKTHQPLFSWILKQFYNIPSTLAPSGKENKKISIKKRKGSRQRKRKKKIGPNPIIAEQLEMSPACRFHVAKHLNGRWIGGNGNVNTMHDFQGRPPGPLTKPRERRPFHNCLHTVRHVHVGSTNDWV